MTPRLAVTGATGFVGRVLVPMLRAKGHDLSVLVRNPAKVNFADDVRCVKGDLNTATALHELTRDADVVLHVAGVVSAARDADFFRANVAGTVALAKAAVANRVKRFIYVSSLAAREPQLGGYGASKAAAEQALQAFASQFELCILRPCAVYGAGDTATLPLLKALMSKRALIPGSPHAKFAMVHVSDVARSLTEAVTGATGTYAVHDGARFHTWPELVEIVRARFNRPQQVTYIPKAAALMAGTVGDAVAKLRGVPSFTSSGQIRQIYHADWSVTETPWPLESPVPLHDGMPQTIRWYQENGLLPDVAAIDKHRAT
jgi:nucleoside-diphosphate-sugar epimerase